MEFYSKLMFFKIYASVIYTFSSISTQKSLNYHKNMNFIILVFERKEEGSNILTKLKLKLGVALKISKNKYTLK